MVNMGNVWDRTAEFLSDNVGAIIPIALLGFFIPASIEGNFEALLTGADFGLVLILRLVQLGFAVLSVWGSVAITAMALDLVSERTPGQIGLRRLPAALVVSIAILVCVMLAGLPVPLSLYLNGHDLNAIARGESVELTPMLAGGIAIYMIVVGALLLWITARLAVTTAVIVRENRVFGSLRQSWQLTRGAALRIVGVLILYLVVSWVAQLAAQTVFGSVFAIVAGDEGDGVTLAGVLTSIVVAAVQAGFLVVLPAFTAKLYLALTAQSGLRRAAA